MPLELLNLIMGFFTTDERPAEKHMPVHIQPNAPPPQRFHRRRLASQIKAPAGPSCESDEHASTPTPKLLSGKVLDLPISIPNGPDGGDGQPVSDELDLVFEQIARSRS